MAQHTQPDEKTGLAPLHWSDLLPTSCTVETLGKLAYLYAGDAQAVQMIVGELERRGIDPYA